MTPMNRLLTAVLQCSPKSTFFFGASAAAMGVFSASTIGAASLK